MARRYTYTPRRGGRPLPGAARGGPGVNLGLVLPIAIVVTVVAVAVIIARGGGQSGALPDRGCAGAECEPLVAADTSTPAPSRTPAAQHTPGTEAAPVISGYAAAVLEEPCGAPLYGLNESLHLPPASLAKIVTAIVALAHGDPDEVVDVTVDGGALSLATDSTVMGLKQGDRLSLIDLVYGLLLRSGHDAALAIAEDIAGDEETFAALMNEEVTARGLSDSHFTNASGLDDPALYTSAYDIASLGAALLGDPRLAAVVATHEYQPAWDRPPIENLNLMLNFYPGAIGVKTGFTDGAGQTIVAAADRDGRRLIVSVLHSEDLYVDASALLDWAFANTASAC